MKTQPTSIMLALVLSGLFAVPCRGQETNWVGVTDFWFADSNWTFDVPNPATDAVIDGGGVVSPVIDTLAGQTDHLIVGDDAAGELTIRDGGSLFVNGFVHLGHDAGGDGTLNVLNGAHVDANNTSPFNTRIGFDENSSGALTVSGHGSLFDGSGGRIDVGVPGDGTLTIANGGEVVTDEVRIGNGGIVEVTGSDQGHASLLDLNNTPVNIEISVHGTLIISDGGRVNAPRVQVGDDPPTVDDGEIIVTGNDSVLDVGQLLEIGLSGSNSMLSVTEGGLVIADSIELGAVVASPMLELDDGEVQTDGFLMIRSGASLHGNGRVNGPVSNGGSITAIGGSLRLGDASVSYGITTSGTLNVGSHTVILDDADQAMLGKLTTLAGGQLEADNGMIFGNNDVLSGHGLVIGTVEGSAQSTITATGGTLTLGDASVTDGFNFAGTLNVGANTVELFDANNANLGTLTTLAGGVLEADNGVRLGNNEVLSGHGQVADRFTGTAQSTITAMGGTLTIGDTSATDGFNFAGTLNVGSNSVVLVDANRALLGVETNLADGGELDAQNGVRMGSEESLTATGNATIITDFLNDGGTVNGPTTAGDLLNFAGDVTGAGDYTGNVLFSAGFSPGNGPAQVSLENLIFGDAATLTLELGGTTSGAEYDRLLIIGDAELGDATMSVNLIDGFVPAFGDTFQVLFAAGTLTGSFDSINLPALAGNLEWDQSQLYSDGVLSIIDTGLPGDYNQNGIVDAADYTVWRDNLGSATSLPNDGTAGVGPDDYDRWVNHFGETAGSGAASRIQQAVPEPSGLIAALFASLLLVPRRRPDH